jgi:hypothetical protein
MEINLDNSEIILNVPTIDLTLDLNSFAASGSGLDAVIHTQSSPSDTWTINHNLGYKPSVQTFSAGSRLMTGDVLHTSVNQTIVYFSSSVGGYARLI